MTERNNLHKGEDAINEVNKGVSNSVSNDVSNDISNDVSKDVNNDVRNDVSNRISQNISTSRSEEMTFWDHLDELRGSIIRMLVAVVVVSFGVFFFKEEVFGVVLAPSHSDFVTYKFFNKLSILFSGTGESQMEPMAVRLINTGLAQQFMLHVKVSLYVGMLLASPYIVYLLFHFISPALYDRERKYALRLVGSAYVMSFAGMLLSYFLIFPLTFRFLGTYQVSEVIENTVTIESYIDTMLTLSLSLAVVFEIPIVCWILGRIGVLSAEIMRKFRRHVIVAVLILSAVITPTADAFTMLFVALPIWLLYELSIFIIPSKKHDLM